MSASDAFVMESVNDLWDHIGYTLEYAPRFPPEPQLLPRQQMTLELAFAQLRQGLDIAYPPLSAPGLRGKLSALLDSSLAEYRNDRAAAGRNLLLEFEAAMFTPEGKLLGAI